MKLSVPNIVGDPTAGGGGPWVADWFTSDIGGLLPGGAGPSCTFGARVAADELIIRAYRITFERWFRRGRE